MNEEQVKVDRYAKSRDAFAWAKEVMPGGVNSPVRAFKSVAGGGDEIVPVTVKSGKGAMVMDVDGNEYVDYVLSYGPLILGHAPEVVSAAMSKVMRSGWTFGMPTEVETQLAQLVTDVVPSVDVVRFVNSGTEAVMSAIRLARAATGRAKVIKCTGCYHGHSDSLLVQAGSGATTLGVPSSPGVPEAITQNTLLVPFNDLVALDAVLKEQGDEVACFVVEPIAGNMGCVPPQDDYLEVVRELCDRHGVLLIFDEVMTGFRVDLGCAQKLYGVMPDLTCMGKVIGGGLPCAAYGGREDLMRQVAPDGPMYQAGTLSGNPLAMAAGLATLEVLRDTDAYGVLETQTASLELGMKQAASDAGVSVYTTRVGSMFGMFFSDKPVYNYEDATACRVDEYAIFFQSMLHQGVMLAPSAYETWFTSTQHDESVINMTIDAAAVAFKKVAGAV
ncbi:Glutamate-1-semialdehyde 2,1-aminomutase [Poriferisphaera corsica]|uniref:Glutamate-1-semialdehyde 2,1-aminomutase n=1 Tax=Poriferisphaera corsica TaxID=2528020 RepID=A0A517YQM6_9BACT|nr:Glutamate-1-semialdehyde 2,1-aminomutase [Poriferisphaera corsica]